MQISLKLRVLPGDKIIVPGCEPATYSTSTSLLQNMNCGRSVVDLKDALEAIPGSKVELAGYDLINTKYFVLPPKEVGCNCAPVVDYYEILKSIAKEPPEKDDSYDHCNVIDQGYCPSPDFEFKEPPPTSTYLPEGNTCLANAVRDFNAGI